MAFMFCMGSCCVCNKTFSFNPDLVPSFRIDGRRQPVCKSCLDDINRAREAKGVDRFPEAHPEAYEPEEVA